MTFIEAHLRAELRLAMLAFRRIAQERGTPPKMREIASARAGLIAASLDLELCEDEGCPHYETLHVCNPT